MDKNDFHSLSPEGSEQNTNQNKISYARKLFEENQQSGPKVINLFSAAQTTEFEITQFDIEVQPLSKEKLCERSRTSVLIICPFCKHEGQTTLTYHFGFGGWFIMIFLLIIFFPLAWIPYRYKGCKDVRHSCSNCKKIVRTCEYEICGSSELIP